MITQREILTQEEIMVTLVVEEETVVSIDVKEVDCVEAEVVAEEVTLEEEVVTPEIEMIEEMEEEIAEMVDSKLLLMSPVIRMIVITTTPFLSVTSPLNVLTKMLKIFLGVILI